jgi:pilus assembly protein Flp/PilA
MCKHVRSLQASPRSFFTSSRFKVHPVLRFLRKSLLHFSTAADRNYREYSVDTRSHGQHGLTRGFAGRKGTMNLQALRNLLRDESGQDLIEYALVAAVIGLAAVAAMSSLANNVSNAFSAVGSKLSSAVA